MSDDIDVDAPTVKEQRARTFIHLVNSGVKPEKAATEAGTTLERIRNNATLRQEVIALIERGQLAGALDAKVREAASHARLMELLTQDEDRRIALGAAKQIQNALGFGAPKVELNFQMDAETKQVIDSLGETNGTEENKTE